MTTKHGWIRQPPFVMLQHSICDTLHEWYFQCRAIVPRITALLWSIWKSQGAFVFQNALANSMGVLICAKRNWAVWKQCHWNPLLCPPSSSMHLPTPLGSIRFIGWAPPPDGAIKLNFNGSLSPTGAAAGYLL